jgi:hypothetical protein
MAAIIADQIRIHLTTQGAESHAYAEYLERQADRAADKAAAKH